MCGIFGFFLNEQLTESDLLSGRKACEEIKHRGPDGFGEWFDREKGIYLGHRRLSIIDVSSASDQPMVRDDLKLVYNGELYNYRELKEELVQKGATFSTEGDTEVLLRAWQTWGAESLNRFDAMFAFAVFDGKKLTIATDAFGEKPLYYVENQKGFYFCSEPEPLIHLLNLKFAPTKSEAAAFMALGFVPAPDTGFAGLKAMPQASFLSVEKGKKVFEKRYWSAPRAQFESEKTGKLEKNEIKKIKDILVRSLQRRLRADVPMGLFLSGGIDSSLVAALALKELGTRLEAFTVSFPDGVDEAAKASEIARHLQLSHQVIHTKKSEDWSKTPERLIHTFGVLNDNTTALSIQTMCELIHDRFKVAMTGLGGDELFYGYNKYQFLHQQRFYYHFVSPLLSFLPEAFIGVLPKGKTLKHLFTGDPWELYVSLKNGGAKEYLKPFINDSRPKNYFKTYRQLSAFEARDFDVEYTLPSSYIPAVDRGSMRASVEVRTPFLSKELFEYLETIGRTRLLNQGSKATLKDILLEYLPNELISKEKRGFVLPLSRYFEKETPLPTSKYLNTKDVKKIWDNRQLPEVESLAFRASIVAKMQSLNS